MSFTNNQEFMEGILKVLLPLLKNGALESCGGGNIWQDETSFEKIARHAEKRTLPEEDRSFYAPFSFVLFSWWFFMDSSMVFITIFHHHLGNIFIFCFQRPNIRKSKNFLGVAFQLWLTIADGFFEGLWERWFGAKELPTGFREKHI